MIHLDFRERKPLYEQIREKMKALIISGALKANEKIPSVRELAQMLTINPNTIQKAYRDLETEGFIYSIRAKGSFVAPLEDALNMARKETLMIEFEKICKELKFINVSKDDLVDSINEIYIGKEGGLND
ncbi:MAG: GntR family transcriptional regulator [Clostridia bacterium BRH_c25]|nr:MAG: GntR family transcriptional regulator [Clostridia bacterium BRH_c25]